MKKIVMWIYLLTKRQLKNKAFTLLLMIMPVYTLIISNIPQMTEDSHPRVGIIMSDEDITTVHTVQKLVDGQYALEFYIAESYQQLVEDVISGRTECGYMFSKNMTDKLDQKQYAGSIIAIKNSSSLLSSLSNEVVFSTMFRIYAKTIASRYVGESEIFTDVRTEALEIVSKNYDFYIDGAATFHIDFQTLAVTGKDAIQNDIEVRTSSFPVRGILSILIYLSGLFGTIQWLKDCENGIFSTMSYSFRNSSRVIYVLIPTVLISISSVMTMMAAGVHTSLVVELVMMVIYVIANAVFSTCMSYVVPSSKRMVSTIPIFIIGSLTLCPVFIDITTYLPIAAWLNKLFLPYYYLTWLS